MPQMLAGLLQIKKDENISVIYVALLRGINVGANNKVNMGKLAMTFQSLGFKNVRTYINSGNVVFEDNKGNTSQLIKKIEAGIAKDFKLHIKVLVRDAKNIKDVCKALSPAWQNNEEMKTDIMFLWDEIDSPKIIAQVNPNPKIDNVKYVSGALLWNIKRKDYGQSALPKIVPMKLYKQMTIRNVNTVRRLTEMMKQ